VGRGDSNDCRRVIQGISEKRFCPLYVSALVVVVKAYDRPITNRGVLVLESFSIGPEFAGTVQFLYFPQAVEQVSFREFIAPVLLVGGRCFGRFRR